MSVGQASLPAYIMGVFETHPYSKGAIKAESPNEFLRETLQGYGTKEPTSPVTPLAPSIPSEPPGLNPPLPPVPARPSSNVLKVLKREESTR